MSKAALALTMIWALASQSAPITDVDPVGTWTFSGSTPNGSTSTGRIEIAGKPGAYTGQIVTSQGRQLKIVDVMTSSNAMIVTGSSTTDNGLVFMRVARQASGAFSGVWGSLPEVGSVSMSKK